MDKTDRTAITPPLIVVPEVIPEESDGSPATSLSEILNKSFKGKLLIELAPGTYLNTTQQKDLVQIIAEHLIEFWDYFNKNSTPKLSDFYADSITALFTSETKVCVNHFV